MFLIVVVMMILGVLLKKLGWKSALQALLMGVGMWLICPVTFIENIIYMFSCKSYLLYLFIFFIVINNCGVSTIFGLNQTMASEYFVIV